MIRVSWQGDGENLQGFCVTGHAGYADHGQDIVCAAVSALAQTAILALRRLTEADIDVQVQEGCLECKVEEVHQHGCEVRLILESMRLGIEEIASNYSEFVRIDDQEV